jgi:hypothetical protein
MPSPVIGILGLTPASGKRYLPLVIGYPLASPDENNMQRSSSFEYGNENGRLIPRSIIYALRFMGGNTFQNSMVCGHALILTPAARGDK